jgi:hypothetical protein
MSIVKNNHPNSKNHDPFYEPRLPSSDEEGYEFLEVFTKIKKGEFDMDDHNSLIIKTNPPSRPPIVGLATSL